MSDQQPMDVAGGVVVGHDRSAPADDALRFALEEARLRGLALHVVRAWSITDAPRPEQVERGVVPTEDEFEAAVTRELAADVAAALGDAAEQVPVVLHAVHTSPTKALVAASAGAALLVVGARGRGGVAALLGSTSEHVVHHASCPVAVLRG